MIALPGLIIALAIVAVLGSSLQKRNDRHHRGDADAGSSYRPLSGAVYQGTGLRSSGKSYWLFSKRIVFRHIAPNCMAIALVVGTYYLGAAILIEASSASWGWAFHRTFPVGVGC